MEEDKRPLSKREYLGLLSLTGSLDALADSIPMLATRGVESRLEASRDTLGEILHDVCLTIPTDKLRRIRKDMDNTKVYTKVEAPGIRTVDTEHHRYVPAKVLNKLVDYVVQHECLLCDKSAVEGRHCPIREMIEDAIPHEVAYKVSNGDCKWSGLSLGLGEWED